MFCYRTCFQANISLINKKIFKNNLVTYITRSKIDNEAYLAVKIDRAALPRTKNHLTMDKYADWLLLYGNSIKWVRNQLQKLCNSFFFHYI